MSNEIDYPTWVASKLPDVTYGPDAGGVWRYWRPLIVGAACLERFGRKRESESLQDGDECIDHGDLHRGLAWLPVSVTDQPNWSYVYRRPIPRPTERLLEAMRDSDPLSWKHPLKQRWTTRDDTAIGYLTACEHSCQAEPGDGKPVAQEKGEAYRLATNALHQAIERIVSLGFEPKYSPRGWELVPFDGIPLPDDVKEQAVKDAKDIDDKIASLQQQVHSLQEAYSELESERNELNQRARAAEEIAENRARRLDDLQQQVAGLTEERDAVAAHHDQLNSDYRRFTKQATELEAHLTARATAAEAERDRLREFVEAVSNTLDVEPKYAAATLAQIVKEAGELVGNGEVVELVLSPAESGVRE